MASWSHLAHLRKRGQRPEGPIIVTDHAAQRANLEQSGAFAVGFPAPDQAYLAAGLEVMLLGDYGETAVETAQQLAAVSPKRLVTFWRGGRWEVVL